MEVALSAYIASNQVEKAINSMKSLEQGGAAAGKVQLYLKLGKLLEREIDALREKKDTVALSRLQKAYRTFLATLAESKTGQTYESLEWAGESLLRLESGHDAEKVFRRILTSSPRTPSSSSRPAAMPSCCGPSSNWRALALSAADKKKFDEANSLVDELLSQYPRYIECHRERHAPGGRGQGQANSNWSDRLTSTGKTCAADCRARVPGPWLTSMPGTMRPMPCMTRTTIPRLVRSLNGIMRLNPGVGSPEMKSKYEPLLKIVTSK